MNQALLLKAVHLYSLLTEDLRELTDEQSLVRDMVTIKNRALHEGLPFLTKTLPKFGDVFFMSLNIGSFQPSSHFELKGALPKFLSGLTSRVFNAETGVLLKDPCYISAYAVRQICYLLYKMEVPYTAEQLDTAINKMVLDDTMLDGTVSTDSSDKVLLLAGSLIDEVLGKFSWEDTSPRHGPGACSHRVDYPYEKWFFHDDGSEFLPDEYFTTPGLEPDAVASSPYDLSTRLGLTPHSLRHMRKSELSAVPKNSKGPRLILPAAVRFVWAQLGIDSLIRKRIKSHPYTRGTIHFDDQSVNARLALEASATGTMATLDLSRASDTISIKLLRVLLWHRQDWYRAIMTTRSTHLLLPSGVDHELKMVATMGNGYTFSLQTLVFWAITAATITVCMEEAYTSEDDLKWACQKTFVYGDDIIVPVEYASTVMSSLERYGFRINRDKSFWTGPFRESCGIDAFQGVDITPLKIKTPPQTEDEQRKNVDAKFISSWWDQSRDWHHLLPRVCAWMKSEVYAGLGFKPFYPTGWEGCIGEPLDYESIGGTKIKAGQQHVSHFQKVIRGPIGSDRSFVILREYIAPPSDGKLVKVVRIKPHKLRAPYELFRNEASRSNGPKDGFTEELGYLRWLNECQFRCDEWIDSPFDPRTFTLRYTAKVVVRREWCS